MRKTDLYKSYTNGMMETLMIAESPVGYNVEKQEEDWTEEELAKIEEYKELLKAARNNKK